MKSNGKDREQGTLVETLSTVNAAALSELTEALAYFWDAVQREAQSESRHGEPAARMQRACSHLCALIEARSGTLEAELGRNGGSYGRTNGEASDPMSLLRTRIERLRQQLVAAQTRSVASEQGGAARTPAATGNRAGRQAGRRSGRAADDSLSAQARFKKKKRANRRRR
ncbi:hypothetical protein [Cohnella sp. 56]|uniref:hypothetical protein n=1 Tax=Cohnella sp. 56 TaxID=3113722 RepID=UPI0030E94018